MLDILAIETALEIAVPIIAGVAIVWLARPMTPLRLKPARTALVLFVVLAVTGAFLSPGGDLVQPTIGLIVSAVVCVTTFLVLRRPEPA
jgi:hypothetical protein